MNPMKCQKLLQGFLKTTFEDFQRSGQPPTSASSCIGRDWVLRLSKRGIKYPGHKIKGEFMKLYCSRHGHAENQPNTEGEHPLTALGREEVGKVAQYLGHRGVHVAHVMHSNKLRSKQTAEIFAKTLTHGPVTESCRFLNPEHPVEPLIELIQSWHDDTFLVGHMPFISQLVSTLVVGNEHHEIVAFPPGTVVCLDRQDQHRWVLSWVLRPDLVPGENA